MDKVNFKNAFYLKLGKGGKWEEELKKGSKARIGWQNVDIIDIQNENWDNIRDSINKEFENNGKSRGATQDFNALKLFCDATEEDIFITFSDGKLYWCQLENTQIQKDDISKYRTTKVKWSSTDIKGKTLFINQISGRISKTQGFRATLCKVEEKESLRRIINAEIPQIVEQIQLKKNSLCESLLIALKDLHWKDLEILADLVFRQSGWRRISLSGEQMKYIDMELIDPITKEKFQVQVKASATKQNFEEYAEKFSSQSFSKLFFVTFNPDSSLIKYKNEYDNVQLLKGLELTELIIDLGLTNWVLDQIA